MAVFSFLSYFVFDNLIMIIRTYIKKDAIRPTIAQGVEPCATSPISPNPLNHRLT